MASLRSRARRLAFGDSTDSLSDKCSSRSSSTTRSDSSSTFSRTVPRHSSSISEQLSFPSMEKTTRVTPRTTNRVRKVRRTQPLETIIEAIETDGCVIVEDFINPQISQRIQSAETFNMDVETSSEPQSPTVVDVNSLIRESLVADTLFQSLSSHFLTLETISWKGKQIQMNSTQPRISSSTTQDINSTTTTTSTSDSSSFQRADSTHHTRHHSASRYEHQSRRDTSIGLFVPEVNSLSDSVSISTIPGSHLWDDRKPNLTKGVRQVDLAGGEALILLGSLYHHTRRDLASQKKTPVLQRTDSGSLKEKLVHEIWMCSGVYRPAPDVRMDESEL